MKPLLLAVVLLLVSVLVTAVLLLTPPPEWRAIHVGTSGDEVRGFIPRPDLLVTMQGAFAMKRGRIVTWRLAVVFNDEDRVKSVQRTTWTNWPEKWTVRTTLEK